MPLKILSRKSFKMTTGICLRFLFVTMVTTGITSGSSEDLPSEWSSMCSVNKTTVQSEAHISIICDVRANDTWSLLDFREWSSRLDRQSYVSLDVFCGPNGRICLPWPYRANHMNSLKVRSCINYCYYLEFEDKDLVDSLPDSLRYFQSDDVTIEVGQMKVLTLDIKKQSPAIECGPLLVKTSITRGGKTNYLPDIPPGFEQNITEIFTSQVADMAYVRHVCLYNNMEVYDLSRRKNSSTNFLHLVLDNSQFPKLKTFNLSACGYQTFPNLLKTWRLRLTELETLDLSHNNISRFDGMRDLSRASLRVGRIDLRYNNIRTVAVEEIKSIDLVPKAVIDIRNNPFECNCAMSNFSHFLQKYHSPEEAGIDSRYSYLWSLRCVSPVGLQGKRIADLSKEVLCSTDVTTYIAQISVLAVVVVALLIVIILMARYRREIRILAFTRLQIVLPCHPVEPASGKRYDAFVAYSHMDSSWVVRTLLPRLENGSDCNFRLCLHERDFEVGAAIADNIVQSVESSRHTILVLSRKFLESEWCLMEFRTAFHQSLIEKKRHLILVLLEDIPLQDLDPDLRVCMQTWTYIHASDRLFWDRVVYALTDKSKTRWGILHRSKSSESSHDSLQDKSLTNGTSV